MQVFNQTRFVHQHTTGMDIKGHEYLSLVVRGTFDFPDDSRSVPQPSAEQLPLVMADEATGEPGFSATMWETDFAFRKPHTEVIAQGAAYAPGGKPAERVRVGIKVDDWVKQFDVVGYREWRNAGPAILATRPVPFTKQTFSYDTAFGGPDRLDPDEPKPYVYMPNPVGRGFATVRNQDRINGLALPNTEEVGAEIRSPYDDYKPMALGPVARGHPDRLPFGGTYDDNWVDNIFPFLPPDFDERYYQSAPQDQWIKPLRSGAQVIIVGMTPAGREVFGLPDVDLPITIFRGRDKCLQQVAKADTLIFDTEARTLSLVWRVDVRIKKHITEFSAAWVGAPTNAMQRAYDEKREYIRAVATAVPGGEEP
ncbi:DUF2169 family type VI secretion system accessory protein [Yoonia sediminilitoris]|uniref:DUF2169 domain-containing protein n=1 Tax=Yoonia sediminilitoris TaxID=1286148 RepID=A0A2T6KM24_9RHOB|nr:DUF2169 domain-containing protein [Yoonia sediminilitoris]PUB17266.1 hypothetical protein C8N45_102278 [Yoonia sediminilitoris]RCW97561.1 hypothetical protein DFP92_102278 [Yoonia sediminilitoris]